MSFNRLLCLKLANISDMMAEVFRERKEFYEKFKHKAEVFRKLAKGFPRLTKDERELLEEKK